MRERDARFCLCRRAIDCERTPNWFAPEYEYYIFRGHFFMLPDRGNDDDDRMQGSPLAKLRAEQHVIAD